MSQAKGNEEIVNMITDMLVKVGEDDGRATWRNGTMVG
jgi:hypothetical protein